MAGSVRVELGLADAAVSGPNTVARWVSKDVVRIAALQAGQKWREGIADRMQNSRSIIRGRSQGNDDWNSHGGVVGHCQTTAIGLEKISHLLGVNVWGSGD